MGRDCKLVLDAKIDKASGVALAKFCKDWQFIEVLDKIPDEGYLSETYRYCESLFAGVFDGESLKELEQGHLQLTYEGKIDDKAIKVMAETFLPKALISLKEFYYEMEEFGSRTDFKFDAKSRRLIESSTKLEESEPSSNALTEEWDEEYGALSKPVWRKHFQSLLTLIGNPELQKNVLVEKDRQYDFDPPYTDFEIWFDLNSYYMGRLNFEAGLDWVEELGFLTSEEIRALSPLDTAIRKFLPKNLLEADARPILRHPDWKHITQLSQDLMKSGFLKTARS